MLTASTLLRLNVSTPSRILQKQWKNRITQQVVYSHSRSTTQEQRQRQGDSGKQTSHCCGSKSEKNPQELSVLSKTFWNDPTTWQRTRVNTLRCLVGCTTGDFAAMWYLQYHYPTMSPVYSMAAAVAAGLTTSLALETVLLKRTIPGLGYKPAFKMAMEMSFASMIAMEMAENMVDWHLMGGQVVFDDPKFWMAALVSTMAGYVVPLPYNYWRLKALGKACH
ncbi:hypothetical protein BCR42DRAFT_419298 [Absidia repens]|uniref:DUF4396 domain-containing protein n=1 Tax=Absidia repens TaxID=90262 RepID=A0A1X2IB47_9FUNG|nr:hypothetical protein BCR42DRAFT_419298 [Absidia repens]